ncbi:hypothetical protein GGG17_05125 [Arsenicicoccus sp. MKL-02]|uniref:Uncharacterized protein n=1 Tax=Arsenicicoccus cauae TaxID=2663847 RepID=A0A6I3IMZ8_9MICO|nr:hypothetical protein [Arsenicicoccus cauae]MTB71360.1 hypothetical protein [Arsenicicoccus cauae]
MADAAITTGAFALGGALLGGLASGWVSWLVAKENNRAAHVRWLSERRAEVYTQFIETWTSVSNNVNDASARHGEPVYERAGEACIDASINVQVFATPETADAAKAAALEMVNQAGGDPDWAPLNMKFDRFMTSARNDLHMDTDPGNGRSRGS